LEPLSVNPGATTWLLHAGDGCGTDYRFRSERLEAVVNAADAFVFEEVEKSFHLTFSMETDDLTN